ncbi:hypothetical protein [Microbacterium sp. NPDC056052]|uniref:hypothetical protein n=1 Tax=Microbacterium sp. NPDC056052 TaxID=3345695 RepID=UPI0035D949E1
MSETPIPRPTRRYVVAIWATAVVIGAVAGVALGLLIQNVWIGVVSGAAVIALVGFSSVLAARREGRGTIEGAPPWTGDAAPRHHNGAP